MTHERDQVKRALWHLERERMPLRDHADEAVRRHRVAAAVNARVRALRDEKRAGSFRRRLWAFACAAVIAAVAAVLWLRSAGRPFGISSEASVATLDAIGPVSVVRGGQRLPVSGLTRLAPTDELTTPAESHARAVLSSGAVVDVSASTSVRFEGNRIDAAGSEELGLEQGTILLKVPKLGPHRRLSIRTPDAIVTVRGTEFRVDVHERDGHSITSVGVLEGSVWVTNQGREITLEKGAEWSSENPLAALVPRGGPAESVAQQASPTVPSGSDARSVASVSPAAGSSVAGSGHEEAKSTLGAENDQYQRGVSAARLGDDRKALSAFDTFLARFPTSPLVQSAEVERFRALKRLGRSDEAARRARQYLATYPAGFARAEAQALAVQTPGAPSAP